MSFDIFQKRLAQELPFIDQALKSALANLPVPCQPIATHILDAGGKRLRPLLTVLSARMCGYSSDNIYTLAASLEMLHAATLLHDDVLDNALSRRGKPTAHGIYGVVETILAGDALLAAGNAIVASFENPSLTSSYSLATSQTAAGEILEMASLRKPDLSFDAYLEIVKGKTACLIAQACVMGSLAAKAPKDMVEAFNQYGENLGLGFQLVDDLLDFAPESQTGKPSGGDLREGKMTPPICLYRASLTQTDREVFDKNFINGAFDDAQLAQLSRQIKAFIPQGRTLAQNCMEKAFNALALLPETPEKIILRQMIEYVANRVN